MKQVHEISLETGRALDIFFDNNSDIIEKSALVTEDVLGFRTRFYAIESKIAAENEATFMSAADIQTFKVDIGKRMRSGLDKINAHALKIKDAVLKEACKMPLTSFTTAKDVDFVKMARKEVDRFKIHKDVLEKYGLMEDFRNTLATDIELYDKMRPQFTVNRSKAVVSTGNRKEDFKELEQYITEVLDISIYTLIDEYPDFVKEYDNVSTGRTPTVSPTRLAIVVIDDATSKPLSKAKIEALLIKTTAETDDNGKCTIKVGSKKELLLRITREGMLPVEVTVTKIMRGKATDVEVRMTAALGVSGGTQ